MDRNLAIKPVIGFFSCIFVVIFIYIYYAPATIRLPISQLFVDSNNNIFLLKQNKIVELESNSKPLQYSLEKNNIASHVGQLIPLASGEYIINSGGQKYSVLHNIKRFLRLTESNSGNYEHPDHSSLLKCDNNFNNCQIWGDNSLIFTMGWSGLELTNNMIIINDTSRHQVRLLDEKGHILDTIDGFLFPNHTVEDNNTIWVVDTDNYRIVGLEVIDNKLIKNKKVIKLSDYNGISNKVGWPSIAYLNDKHWWVMINGDGMSHPNIYRLNSDNSTTQFANQLKDSTAMLVANNYLYLAQYPENLIWKFDTKTGDGQLINNQALAKINQQDSSKLAENKLKLWTLIAVISLFGVIFLIFAIINSTPIERSRAKPVNKVINTTK